MRLLLLWMLLITGCTTTRVYRVSELRQVLQENAIKLAILETDIEKDYLEKEAFYQSYRKEQNNKRSFMLDDLNYRIRDLNHKKDLILKRTQAVRTKNEHLLVHLEHKSKIKETDRVFEEIEDFADSSQKDTTILFKELIHYRSASDDFTRFAMIVK